MKEDRMEDEEKNPDADTQEASMLYLFPEAQSRLMPAQPKKLKLDSKLKRSTDTFPDSAQRKGSVGIPQPILPTRWEQLQRSIENRDVNKDVLLSTIIRPVDQAMDVIREIVEYLQTTNGCQVLVIRADTGSGKTTFLNTLPHYMQDIGFDIQTIDIQNLEENEFGPELRGVKTSSTGINLIILEGREKPESIPDKYIQVVLANINRFARHRSVPLLFVIPTVEDEVARSWCDHAIKIGDLIPEHKLHEGSRWYNFPGVPKDEYIEIASRTIRALNPPYSPVDFGVSPDELKNWVNTASTIGRYIEIIASKISTRRRATALPASRGRKEHVWIVYCTPDLRHYDHTYHVINGLVQDEKFKVSPAKLVPPDSDTPYSKNWRQSLQWTKLVATINFLDIRLINFPIIAAVTAALTYGDDDLLQSFKKARIRDYKEDIPDEMKVGNIPWDKSLAARKLSPQHARDSLGGTNLFSMLRGMSAQQQKGGNLESVNILAQYLHLRKHASESDIHYFIGCALKDLLEYDQYPNFLGVETEEPLIQGQQAPVPDIAIHTRTDVFALEFHFMRKQVAPSEISRYALNNVIDKYMKTLPHLNSLLETIIE